MDKNVHQKCGISTSGAPNIEKIGPVGEMMTEKNILKSLPVPLHQPSHPGLCFIFYFMFIYLEALQGNSTRFKAKGNALCCPWKKGAAGTWWWFFFSVQIPFVNVVGTEITGIATALPVEMTLGQDTTFLFSCLAKKPRWKLFSPPCLCLSVFVTPAARK